MVRDAAPVVVPVAAAVRTVPARSHIARAIVPSVAAGGATCGAFPPRLDVHPALLAPGPVLHRPRPAEMLPSFARCCRRGAALERGEHRGGGRGLEEPGARGGAFAGGCLGGVAEDEGGVGEQVEPEGAQGREAGGYDVIGGLVDGPNGPD